MVWLICRYYRFCYLLQNSILSDIFLKNIIYRMGKSRRKVHAFLISLSKMRSRTQWLTGEIKETLLTEFTTLNTYYSFFCSNLVTRQAMTFFRKGFGFILYATLKMRIVSAWIWTSDPWIMHSTESYLHCLINVYKNKLISNICLCLHINRQYAHVSKLLTVGWLGFVK